MSSRKTGGRPYLRLGALLDSAAAVRALNISRASLYVYVSRGLVRSVRHPSEPKARLYSASDILALIDRRTRMRRPRAAAATALDYGLPVLRSGITRFEDNRCFYRGKEAVAFSRKATLEEAARLLWNTGETDPFAGIHFDPRAIKGWAAIASKYAPARATSRASMLLPLLAPGEVTSDFSGAARLVVALVAAAARIETSYAGPLHRAIATAWHRPKAADAIRRALVLLADHELNASTFAVRVVASTGAELADCVIAGLAAMGGPKHGGATGRLGAMLAEIEASDATSVLATRLGRGELLPGFGNSVYRDADPRGAELISAVKLDPTMAATLLAARDMARVEPNVDFGLLALERGFDLPEGASLALFAMGRSIGWIAHAFEQQARGGLIRPRAEFVVA